jgi:hypothetical protein
VDGFYAGIVAVSGSAWNTPLKSSVAGLDLPTAANHGEIASGPAERTAGPRAASSDSTTRDLPPAGHPVAATGFGTLDLFVQPVTAEVRIDGQLWVSSEEGHVVIQLPAGKHRVEITTPDQWTMATDVAVGDGATVPFKISLMAGST